MYFDSFTALVAMGGHGKYVWLCYFITFAVMTGLVVWVVTGYRYALRRQHNLHIHKPKRSLATKT